MIVVDASVAVKWLLAEADSEAAFALLAEHGNAVAAPDLLLIEVARALIAAANSRRIDRARCEAALDEWLAIAGGFDLHRSGPQTIATASRIALDLGHPLADCLYLALAVERGCDLVTADAKFTARARVTHDRITLLA